MKYHNSTFAGSLTIPLDPTVAIINVFPSRPHDTPLVAGFLSSFSVDQLLQENVPFFDGPNFDHHDGQMLKAAFVHESNQHILGDAIDKYSQTFFEIVEKEVDRFKYSL